MPVPLDSVLVAAAKAAGLLLPSAVGLTLGHAVFIRRSHAGKRRLLRHELRHVAQNEAAGSIDAFLEQYLEQVVRYGYADAPLEIDAHSFELGRPTSL